MTFAKYVRICAASAAALLAQSCSEAESASDRKGADAVLYLYRGLVAGEVYNNKFQVAKSTEDADITEVLLEGRKLAQNTVRAVDSCKYSYEAISFSSDTPGKQYKEAAFEADFSTAYEIDFNSSKDYRVMFRDSCAVQIKADEYGTEQDPPLCTSELKGNAYGADRSRLQAALDNIKTFCPGKAF